MSLQHPFCWISPPKQKQVFVALAILTIIVMASMQLSGNPLRTAAAPSGIVSFEFAGALPAAQAIVDSWGQQEQVYAGLNLGLDYLFLMTYAASIGLGCVVVASAIRQRSNLLSSAGVPLAWGLIVAGLLDAVENYALIQLLLGSERELWPLLARWCAAPKFMIVALGLLYILSGAAVISVTRARGSGKTAAG